MIRIGIDVGGTFTKAVAVDRTSGQIMARAVVPTTHRAPSGVAEGAVAALLDLLAQERIRQDEIAFLTLSTTQAVNALLEGDVAPVGILAIGPRRERRQIQRLTRIERIDLAPGRTVPLHYVYLDRESVSESSLREAITSLRTAGAAVLAVSAAYAVEDPSSELMALEVAKEFDIPATAGSQLTGLYGLQVRTLTAAVNASILPKMRETTAWLRTALWEADIRAPKMILTGDLSIAPIDQLAELPATSILSGPAASVAGALSSQPAVEALFVEVGGTSTNLGVIRNGRPALRYVRILHHPTCLRSVDVHIAGIGGGSLIRIDRGRLIGIGPRSAHIAGLPYASFAREVTPPFRLEIVAPQPGDRPDYAVVRDAQGRRVALTVTDAANVLGLLPPDDYAAGNRDLARAAFEPLAASLGKSVDEVAREVLLAATDTLVPLARELLQEYDVRQPRIIGLGGGASVLVPLLAQRLALPGTIAPHAEIMASIGDATTPLSWLEEVHVRSGSDLLSAVEQVEHRLIALGAGPESIQVVAEPIPERHASRIRAVALESSLRPTSTSRIDRARAQQLAAEALGVASARVHLQFENTHYWVFSTTVRSGFWLFRRERRALVVVDRTGAICFRADDGWCRVIHGDWDIRSLRRSHGCACAIVGSRCLLFDRALPDDLPFESAESACLLVAQPLRA